MKLSHLFAVAGLSLSLAAAACSGTDAPAATPGSDGAVASSVTPTGNVIEVKMISDPSRGEIFEPADFTVQPGDMVRFVLSSGVHNANFTAGNNVAGVTLPPTTPYLQVPGQTFEFIVEQPAGEYYYQCDPHVALGMVGHMTVVE